ncbi:Cd2+/Zn2+-exporting ATPase [Acinetobacter calcoaceticus]|uniref:P-type Zn(2+) transporter n=1 Tax=Acinetobacter calcoaceticus TaxID=471 RepID=A0A4R1XW12_ACICA|nr:Cd2+/Zn2+-exporting ATPase [Acinetobacter calcoaceticus]
MSNKSPAVGDDQHTQATSCCGSTCSTSKQQAVLDPHAGHSHDLVDVEKVTDPSDQNSHNNANHNHNNNHNHQHTSCNTTDNHCTTETADHTHAVAKQSCCGSESSAKSSCGSETSTKSSCGSDANTQSSCGGSSHTHAEAVPVALAATQQEGEYLRSSMRIMQMDCPTEEGLIQKKLGQMDSVIRLEFNLMQRVLTVVHVPAALPKIVKALQELGFEPELSNDQGKFDQPAVEKQQPLWLLAVAGCFAIGAEIGDWMQWSMWFTMAASVIAIALSGIGTYKKGLIAVRNLNLNINALMSVAVTGAVLIGQWPEAAMVMVLFTLAELIEARSLARARNAISQLMQLAPEKVTMLQADGQWETVEATQVAIGSIVRVKPGEKIGLDGVMTKGQSSINQSPITGESLPVDKVEGDTVFAGTINEVGSFEYRVTAGADNTTLARIIHAVEEAQGEKAPTQRFVDRFSKIYTPLVFIFAILIAIIPPLFMGGVWVDWIYKALVILVIACPCALVISTPVTVVSGLAAAARQGILIKGGVYLEQGRLLKYLAFDKTGTITHGKPKQTDLQVLAGDATEIATLLISLAGRSDHPVSQAIVKAAATDMQLIEVDEFTALTGRGTRGVMNGVTYWLGNHRLIHELEYCSAELEAQITQLEQQGKTVVLFAKNQQVLALAAVADTVKATSAEAIASLQKLGVKTLMLSGDNTHTVEAIAQQVGMNDAKGNLLPEDKLNLVASYAETSSIGMVGDGINDAPALARANVGFAMGSMGTDVAIETADVALMDDDLRKIPRFIELSTKTHQILIQNISLALLTKAFFLILTLMNLGSMWMAVFADVGVSLLVVANGLRLLKQKK